MTRQVDDLRGVLQWLHRETQQRVLMLGMSIGAAIALQAVEHEPDRVRAVIAISPDSRTADSDAAADAFLRAQARGADRRIRQRVKALGPPPYVDPGPFQRRARLLADLGTIERKMTFNSLIQEFLVALIRTYGLAGGVRALRNMNVVQRKLLPEMAPLDLVARPPRITVPVHYVYGEQDALTPESLLRKLPAAIAAPRSTVLRVPDAGHMVHFDQPMTVRSIVERA